MWPSTQLAEIAVDRGRAHGKADITHLRYPGAGHQISIPGSPSIDAAAHPRPQGDASSSVAPPPPTTGPPATPGPRSSSFLREHG